jgi:hypothetical protein
VLIADDFACEHEKSHLPEGAWPPTAWFEGWAHGLDVFVVESEESPIELRWLVYQKEGCAFRPAVRIAVAIPPGRVSTAEASARPSARSGSELS